MINKKLLSFDRKALHYVGLNVLFQWLGMLCNVVLVMTVSRLIGGVFAGSLTKGSSSRPCGMSAGKRLSCWSPIADPPWPWPT